MIPWFRSHLLFIGFAVIPTVLAAIYFGLVASDVYISESRFVVRSPTRQVQSGLIGQLLQTSGFSRSQDDTYSVHDYILSRDALRKLDGKLGVLKSFSSSSVDPINRFAGIGWDHSFEEFFRYYGKHVGVDYDPISSISILTVRAFTAENAYKINSMLIELSEGLVNTLNDRSRHDLIEFADNEVKLASDKAKNASLALLSYRSSQSIFEPDRQAAIQLEGVAKIQQELISTEGELAQIRALSPSNPQIPALESRADNYRGAINTEAAKITGAHGSFSARAPDFERLALDVEFADKQLGVALASLESARAEAQQKQLYLERLVEPGLPDVAMEPRRIRGTFTIFLLGLIAWGVVTLLVASIREHSD